MGVAAERLGHGPLEFQFDGQWVLARREAGAVADPEHVGIDGERLLAPSGVEDDIGGLAPDPGQRLQGSAVARDFPAMIADQRLRQRDDVPGLGVEQADRLDRLAQRLLPQREHVRWLGDASEQRPGSDIDADIGRLRRQRDRDQERIGVGELELGGRCRIIFREAAEEFENLALVHSAPTTSCIE